MNIEYTTETEPSSLIPLDTFMVNNNLTLLVCTCLNGTFRCQIKNAHILDGDVSVVTYGEGKTKGAALHKLAYQIYNKLISGPALNETPVLAEIIVENPSYYDETYFS